MYLESASDVPVSSAMSGRDIFLNHKTVSTHPHARRHAGWSWERARNMKRMVTLALLCVPTLAAAHEPAMGTWESYPRAAITIVVDKNGGRIMGPGWERAFTPRGHRPVRIQLDDKSWFILRLRRDGAWMGTYHHPSVRPGEKGRFKRHLMLLPRK